MANLPQQLVVRLPSKSDELRKGLSIARHGKSAANQEKSWETQHGLPWRYRFGAEIIYVHITIIVSLSKQILDFIGGYLSILTNKYLFL